MIVIPYSTIEPIKQKLSSSFQTDNEMADHLWTQSMNDHLKGTFANAIVKLGDTEDWVIENRSDVAHPFHQHLVQFFVQKVEDLDGNLAQRIVQEEISSRQAD